MEGLADSALTKGVPVVRTVHLSKHYGRRQALVGLDLELLPGEILGLLGPNGAGKTTALRAILGFIRPTSGQVTIFGVSPRAWRARPLRKHIGYLPADLAFEEAETGGRLLELFGKLSGVSPKLRGELCERFQLSASDLRLAVRKYSRGMKQKLGLIAALQHDPSLIILDEPTNALDPVAQQALHDVLKDFVARGAAVLFSTHVLSEALELCDRIAVLSEGHLLDCFSVAAFTALAPRLVYIKFDNCSATSGSRILHLPYAEFLGEEDGWLVYRVESDVVPAVLQELVRIPLADLRIESAALEHLLDYYRQPQGELR